MVLDSEQQRQVLLQLIAASNVPGNALEVVLDVKRSIERAEVKEAPNGSNERTD
jgi:hypothetical protein